MSKSPYTLVRGYPIEAAGVRCRLAWYSVVGLTCEAAGACPSLVGFRVWSEGPADIDFVKCSTFLFLPLLTMLLILLYWIQVGMKRPTEGKMTMRRSIVPILSLRKEGFKMSTTAIKQAPITRTIFDLSTMEEVLLVKAVPDFIPAENSAEVLARVGNDTTKLLAIMNDGLRAAEREAIANNNEPFHTFELDESGEPTDKVNGPFSGIAADSAKVNALVLTLAKTVFAYSKSMSKDEKRAAKQNALEMVRTNDAIKAGLQKSAAIVNAPKQVETPATPAV